MSETALCTLVGTALTDSEFRDKLLRGERHSLLAEFDLTDEERESILAIEAESVQEFAAQLCERLKVQESITSHLFTRGRGDVVSNRP